MITQKQSIQIQVDCQTAFRYIADLRNDRHWRSEVRSTTRDSISGVGNVAIEESYLSQKVPSFSRQLVCSLYLKNSVVVYETANGDPYFLKSTRSFRHLADHKTEVTYLLEFDPAVVRYGLGFGLPNFIVNTVTRMAMKKYLRKLKQILEA